MDNRTCANQLAPVTDVSGTRTISYDGRGNTTAETRPGGVTVAASYDGHAQLTGYSRSNIGAQTYFYNGMGDRVRVVKPTGTRHFVYDTQGRVVAEYGASASEVKAEFIWAVPPGANDNAPFGGDDGIVGYAPLALVTTNTSSQLTLYWVHGNHLGVPTVTTNALGQVVDPGNDFLRPGFPGQSQLLSDLYYNRARDYDPVLGRYIQADPIGLLGGANPYLYANADPVNMVDPDGWRALPLNIGRQGQFALIGLAAVALGEVNRQNAINQMAGTDRYCPPFPITRGGSDDDDSRCRQVLEKCRDECSDRYANDPSSLPGVGRNFAGRIRRCIRECMVGQGCYNF